MFSDFQKQKDIKFDIIKLRQALKQVLNKKGFDDAEGISHFGAISLNQIPGDLESTKGKNVRGVFWTKPDSSGKEVLRDRQIKEEAYTEFVKEFENTYFKKVYDTLAKKFKLGRVRILLIENVAKHLPADGSVWITNNTKYHNAFNGGEEGRIHLVACVLNYKFN
jgi:hypothetical protein